VAAYPFTTISPNVGRGFVVLPDPAPHLGLAPEAVKASWGHALSFDLDQVNPAYSRVAPLQRLVGRCGWEGMLWRRLPVTVKDVAGLVPGEWQ
jgi:ribosome-binding ATPase YchF (GTP1/OBG family)